MACVLIVEDDTLVLLSAELVLQEANYVTRRACSLAEGEALVCSAQPLDLIFTDVRLGNDYDGGLVIGRIAKEARSGTPVLYTSGHLINDYPLLAKPYTARELLQAVADLLPQRRD